MKNHTLIAQAEFVCDGTNTHDIAGLLNKYRFCHNVIDGKLESLLKPERQNEFQLWAEMIPIYEAAIEKVIASKGKVIPDTLEDYYLIKKKLGIKDL